MQVGRIELPSIDEIRSANGTRISLNADQLRVLLLDAKVEHEEFERQHGPDADWPRWYAEYILRRVNSGDVPWVGCR